MQFSRLMETKGANPDRHKESEEFRKEEPVPEKDRETLIKIVRNMLNKSNASLQKGGIREQSTTLLADGKMSLPSLTQTFTQKSTTFGDLSEKPALKTLQAPLSGQQESNKSATQSSAVQKPAAQNAAFQKKNTQNAEPQSATREFLPETKVRQNLSGNMTSSIDNRHLEQTIPNQDFVRDKRAEDATKKTPPPISKEVPQPALPETTAKTLESGKGSAPESSQKQAELTPGKPLTSNGKGNGSPSGVHQEEAKSHRSNPEKDLPQHDDIQKSTGGNYPASETSQPKSGESPGDQTPGKSKPETQQSTPEASQASADSLLRSSDDVHPSPDKTDDRQPLSDHKENAPKPDNALQKPAQAQTKPQETEADPQLNQSRHDVDQKQQNVNQNQQTTSPSSHETSDLMPDSQPKKQEATPETTQSTTSKLSPSTEDLPAKAEATQTPAKTSGPQAETPAPQIKGENTPRQNPEAENRETPRNKEYSKPMNVSPNSETTRSYGESDRSKPDIEQKLSSPSRTTSQPSSEPSPQPVSQFIATKKPPGTTDHPAPKMSIHRTPDDSMSGTDGGKESIQSRPSHAMTDKKAGRQDISQGAFSGRAKTSVPDNGKDPTHMASQTHQISHEAKTALSTSSVHGSAPATFASASDRIPGKGQMTPSNAAIPAKAPGEVANHRKNATSTKPESVWPDSTAGIHQRQMPSDLRKVQDKTFASSKPSTSSGHHVKDHRVKDHHAKDNHSSSHPEHEKPSRSETEKREGAVEMFQVQPLQNQSRDTAVANTSSAETNKVSTQEKVAEMQKVVDQIVSRVLVTKPGAGQPDELRLMLSNGPLKGTEISIMRQHGDIHLNFNTPGPETQALLTSLKGEMSTYLRSKLPNERFEVRIQEGKKSTLSGKGPVRRANKGRGS
ncbi:hypothetical protein BTA51_14195 [Hahella sp. CCB-MM4]|uniref:hypothetical protein n=1 Tax=Hahella sp. (strain CCB-MM4) TaxID=1926491 RepID=UPI000B9ACA82|nr:hypothetical protein [Hahella sp. CCB-MM4]OZG72676.1 hypothetical protein BTA51_14195 [Hahella sp. CCB-MM4]